MLKLIQAIGIIAVLYWVISSIFFPSTEDIAEKEMRKAKLNALKECQSFLKNNSAFSEIPYRNTNNTIMSDEFSFNWTKKHTDGRFSASCSVARNSLDVTYVTLNGELLYSAVKN